MEAKGGGCWQSMLLIRKARPLLWDQPSSRVRGEPSCGVKRKERKYAAGGGGVESRCKGAAARGRGEGEREREGVYWWWAREGETEKRARGLFLARPTSGKTPLIGTWLPVGATNFVGGGGRYLLRFRSETVCAEVVCAAVAVAVAMAMVVTVETAEVVEI